MRNKYHAVKVKGCPHCGRTHDSMMEARECAYLHLLMLDRVSPFVHIDVHPTVTLPGHIRWVLDFCVWERIVNEPLRAYFIDVKGVLTADFKLKRQLFNTSHPAAPLVCVKWRGNKRVVLE